MAHLAVDVGGTKIAAARVSIDGTVEGEVLQVATPAADGAAAVVSTIVDLLGMLDRHGVSSVGIAAAGVIDSVRGSVVSATSSITGWAGTPLASEISASLGVPVFAINDGHAFAIGEAAYGAGRGAESLLMLAAGTGIGGSYVSRCVPMLGSRSAAGHFGHLPVPQASGLRCYCGKVGHLEAIASGAGIVHWYTTHGGSSGVESAREVVELVDHEDVARQAVVLAASAFGVAAAGLVNAVDPEIVVVSGGLSRAGAVWEDPVREAFHAGLMPLLEGTPLVISDATGWPSLRGAAYYAKSREEEK